MDEKYYLAEKQCYDDDHSGDFRDMPDFEELTPQEIADEVIRSFKKNFVIIDMKTPPNPNYDYEKENHKKCPICGKVIDYRTMGYYHDQIQNVWICCNHKLKEIQSKLS